MCSELECGICYQTYNSGRRCPRELRCHHAFCESCLRALTRPLEAGVAHRGAGRVIDCPLCRQPTCLSGDGDVRTELRVAESTLEQLVNSGVLDRQEEEPEDDVQVQDCDREADVTETPAEESEPSARVTDTRLRRTVKKVWRAITGQRSRRGRDECITSDEMRSMAMMACYMF